MVYVESRRKATIYTSLIATIIVVFYNLLRVNLDFHLHESIQTLCFALFLLNFPLTIVEVFTIKSKTQLFKDEYTWMFILLLVCSLLGLLSIVAGYVLSVLGVVCFFRNIFLFIKTITRKEIIPFFFLIIIGIWFSITAWKGDYIHPMLLERFVFDDRIHIDTLYHVSFAQMIKTYLVPSTGLSGVPFIHYHFGSHFIFACLSKTLNINLFTFYQLSYPAIFLPLLVKVLSGFPIIWAEKNNSNNYKLGFWFWFFVSAAFIGIFPLFKILSKAALESPAAIVSESYNLSISLMLLIFNILLFNYQSDKEDDKQVLRLKPYVFLIVLLLMFLLGITKNSTLYIVDIIAFYLFFRLALYRQRITILFFGLMAMISIICLVITIDPNSKDGAVDFFHFYKSYINLSVLRFIGVYYFWSLTLLLGCIALIVINKRRNVKHKEFSVVAEIALLVCVLGALPGILFSISGGSAGYFMDVHIWVSVVLIISIFPRAFELISDFISGFTKKVKRLAIVTFLVMVTIYAGIIMQYNFRKSVTIFAKHNLEDKLMICGEFGEGPITDKLSFMETLKGIKNINPRIGAYLSKNQDYMALKQLYEIDTMPVKEKSQTMIHLGNITMLSQKYPCYKYPLFIPALTGMAIKDGYIFEECHGVGYGFEYYKREEVEKRKLIVTKAYKGLLLSIDSGNVVLAGVPN